MAMEKHRIDDSVHTFPSTGEKASLDLISHESRERFVLDIIRGRRNALKITFQNRAREIIPIVRLDIGGRPHTNPDLTVVPQPHLHLYREGSGDEWAMPAPPHIFSDCDNIGATLLQFMDYCNIIIPPLIQGAPVV